MTNKKPKTRGFSDEEKAAMRARIQEEKAAANKAAGESMALAAIAKMAEPDRSIAKRIHAIVKENAPSLSPKTWYGMPAYAGADGKAVCYFRDRNKFKVWYAMLCFNDGAILDVGSMWPIAFALPKLTAADEAKIAALVKKAAG